MRAGDRRQRLGHGLHRDAVGGDAPLGDERVQGVVHGVVGVDRRGRAVQLDEVEGLDAEVLPRAVRPGAEGVERVRLGHMGVRATAHLRRDRQAMAPALGEQPPDEPFAAPVAVDVGGVQEGHARVDRRVQDRHRAVLGDLSPVRAELPAALSHDRHRPTSPAQHALVHAPDATVDPPCRRSAPSPARPSAPHAARSRTRPSRPPDGWSPRSSSPPRDGPWTGPPPPSSPAPSCPFPPRRPGRC